MTSSKATPARAVRRRRTLVALAIVAVLVVAGLAAAAVTNRRTTPAGFLGELPAGAAWRSGAWTGGDISAQGQAAFGSWRGRPTDVALTYPERASYQQIVDSKWHISTFAGYPGRLVYGLPLVPEVNGKGTGEGSLKEVADGKHDDVWRSVARDLVQQGRGDTIVRVGWEANGSTWYPWGATAATAGDFKAAYRHVVGVLRAEAPDLVMGFDVSCGTGLVGSTDRTAALTQLYPGDDVVDIVGCDIYDAWKTHADDEASWQKALRPDDVVGLADLVEFAEAHDKPFAVPEWGLWKAEANGGGDNPFFISRMHRFFDENASRMAYEAYFDEPADYIRSSIIGSSGQNVNSSAEYRSGWSKKP